MIDETEKKKKERMMRVSITTHTCRANTQHINNNDDRAPYLPWNELRKLGVNAQTSKARQRLNPKANYRSKSWPRKANIEV